MPKDIEAQGVGASEWAPPAVPKGDAPPPQELVPSLQVPTPPPFGAAGAKRKRPQRTSLQNPQQQKARALKMLEKRVIEGKTVPQIAQEFNVSTQTAQRALSFAAKGDLIVGFEDTLLKDLVPLAQTAAKMALMEGNAKVALEVLKGVGLLRGTHTRTQTQVAEEDALSRYIAQKRAHSQLLEETIDADPTDPAALTSADAGPDAGPTDAAPESGRAAEAPTALAGPDPHPAVAPQTDGNPGGLDV